MADKDDRPGGMLEISRSLEKDINRWEQGKGEAPPVENFLSDSALQEIERATKARETPVRADQLRPITPWEAKQRRTQHGEELPNMPAQRRVLPAPFQRPRINAGSHGKTWQDIPAENLSPGDIVPGVGRVVSRSSKVVYVPRESVDAGDAFTAAVSVEPGEGKVAVGEVILVEGAGGEVKAFRHGTRAQAFR